MVFFIAIPASSHYETWNTLYEEVIALYKEGRTGEAIASARQAIVAAENRFGPDHPYVAVSLNILAQLYFETGEYAWTEPLYLRALDIYRTSMGPESLGVAQTLTSLSGLYLKMNRTDESFRCLTEAQRIYAILCKEKFGYGQR